MRYFVICLLFSSISFTLCSDWKKNVLVTFSKLLAQGGNLTDCWICYQDPLDSIETRQYVAFPVNFTIIENEDSHLTLNIQQSNFTVHALTHDYNATPQFNTDPLHIYSLPGPFSILSPSPLKVVTDSSVIQRGACNETTCCLDEPHGGVCGSGYVPQQNCPENCTFQGFLFKNKTGDCPYMVWTGQLETRRIFYNDSHGLSEPHEGSEQCYLFTNHSVWDIQSPKGFNETRLFNDSGKKYKHILGTFTWWNPLTTPLPSIKALDFSHPNKTREICAPHGFYFLCAPKQPIWVDRHIQNVPRDRLVLAYPCLTNQWHRSTCGLGMLSWTTVSIFSSGNFFSIHHTYLQFDQSSLERLGSIGLSVGTLSPWGGLSQEDSLRNLSQQLGDVAFDPDFEFSPPQVDAIYSLTNMVLNYRLTFEYLLAKQREVCVDLGIACCTYINNSSMVEEDSKILNEKGKWQ